MEMWKVPAVAPIVSPVLPPASLAKVHLLVKSPLTVALDILAFSPGKARNTALQHCRRGFPACHSSSDQEAGYWQPERVAEISALNQL